MFTKTIAAFALLAALGTGAYAMSSSRSAEKKVGVVEVTVLEWSAAEEVDCEYTVTPNSVTISGDRC